MKNTRAPITPCTVKCKILMFFSRTLFLYSSACECERENILICLFDSPVCNYIHRRGMHAMEGMAGATHDAAVGNTHIPEAPTLCIYIYGMASANVGMRRVSLEMSTNAMDTKKKITHTHRAHETSKKK